MDAHGGTDPAEPVRGNRKVLERIATIETIAAELGLSRETIRSQVKGVLAKTGTTRQSDLISLLANETSAMASGFLIRNPG